MSAGSGSSGPLAGVQILDLTRILAGPFCTMMLAELGARVIKVEKPAGGDDARQYPPFVEGQSAYFLSLNRGKESIALDLKQDADLAVFRDLLGRSDVLVENFRPGTLERLGFGYESLRSTHPSLIYASISGFGHTGPWRNRPAYDLIAQALGGLMDLTRHPGGPATKVGTSIGDIAAGLFALTGICSALYQRERTGQGTRVDVSLLDGQIAILESAVVRYAVAGEPPPPTGNRHPSITPFAAYETADVPIIIAAGNDLLFQKVCKVLGRPDLAVDIRFLNNAERTRQQEALRQEMEGELGKAAAAHWLERLEAAGVPCSPIQNVAEAVEHPQVRARNMVVSAGGLRMAGNPIKIEGCPDLPTRQPAPLLDADGARIRRELTSGNAPSPRD